MYYLPQTSPLPPHAGVEAWAATRAVEQIEQIRARDDRPYYGFVSFIGPHPPCAPPVPFNRMYNPDAMASPRRDGPLEIDEADEQVCTRRCQRLSSTSSLKMLCCPDPLDESRCLG